MSYFAIPLFSIMLIVTTQSLIIFVYATTVENCNDQFHDIYSMCQDESYVDFQDKRKALCCKTVNEHRCTKTKFERLHCDLNKMNTFLNYDTFNETLIRYECHPDYIVLDQCHAPPSMVFYVFIISSGGILLMISIFIIGYFLDRKLDKFSS